MPSGSEFWEKLLVVDGYSPKAQSAYRLWVKKDERGVIVTDSDGVVYGGDYLGVGKQLGVSAARAHQLVRKHISYGTMQIADSNPRKEKEALRRLEKTVDDMLRRRRRFQKRK